MSPQQHQSGAYANRYIPTPATHQDPLRLEHGWNDVISGLTRMLIGYLLILFSMGLAVSIVVSVAMNGAGADVGGAPDLTNVWIVTGGGGAITLLMMFSYYLILTGKWTCAIYAPDRCGAKWVIFICMISLLFGPIVGIALNFSAASSLVDNPEGFIQRLAEEEQLMRVGITELIGPAISLMTTILFIVFIRQVGTCFQNSFLSFAADLYLMFAALLAGATGFLMFNPGLLETMPAVAVFVGLGWLASLVCYLALILFARLAIQYGMASLRSPLHD